MSMGIPLHAAGTGQDDLDKATDAKLNASTIGDLSETIRLAESALKKGLDKSNTEFANQLLASSLIQRAHEIVKQIAAGAISPNDFRQKRDAALADVEKSIKLDAKQAESYLLLAQLSLLPGGDVKKAREAIGKALELGLEDPSAHAKALLLRAGLQDTPEKKLADLNEAVKVAPGDAAAIRARGALFADLNKLEPALADLNKALELEPDDSHTYEAKALVLARLKKYDEALATLDKARHVDPDSIMPLVQRARVHSSQANLNAAIEDLNQALAMEPTNVVILLMRAGVHQEKGEKDKAMIDVDRALRLEPNLPVAIRTRALLLTENKQFAEAIAELEKLRKIAPKDTLTLLQLAMLYGAEKKPDRSMEAYAALLAVDPEEWRALRGCGDILLNVGKQAEAVAYYEKALAIQPKDHGILNNFAWVLATSPDDKIRNGKRAVELAKQACEVTDYKLAYILSTLAAAYAETGDFDAALKWSSKAVEISDKKHAKALQKELESYKAKKPWRELLNGNQVNEENE
jgi:tetratricopeptide (TPR) repeat protein